MESYSQYKDSCIPWYGAIPHHWRIAQIRRLFEISRGRVISGLEMNTLGAKYPVFSSQTVNSGIMGYLPTYDFDVPQLTWTTDGANAGTVFLRTGKYSCTNICGILKPLRKAPVDLRYFHYCLGYTCEFHKRRDTNGYKIMSNEMASISVVLPPLEEQISIGTYLDHHTEEIDGVVGKLQRQRELLERYKREMIAHTAIRGLNPDAPMKDSGLEWIGQIPRNWTLLRIGALYDERSTKVSDSEFPALSVTMNGICPQLDSVAKTNDRDNRKLIRAGDFVINSRSDRRGACGIAHQDGSCSLINIVLQPQQTISSPYFSYLFRSALFADEFYKWGHGIVDDLWTTNWRDMKTIYVPVPPLSEQQAIAAHLDTKTSEIDELLVGIDRQVELLQKYRRQLIVDVVTGRARVCEDGE